MAEISLDEYFMISALNIARGGIGRTAPNPTVGCVIVNNGVVVGWGRTGDGGKPHAEFVALSRASELARGATLYVTLEPCSHYGRAHSCTKMIIDFGVRRVVIATSDPNRSSCEYSLRILREANIEIVHGIMQREADEINNGFSKVHTSGRPYVTVKMAVTLDGKIADHDHNSRWLTESLTRKWVHKLRAEYDAIMIGRSTLETDDPALNCRIVGLERFSPIRIVIGDCKRDDYRILQDVDKYPVWFFSGQKEKFAIDGVRFLEVEKNSDGLLNLKAVLRILAHEGITRLLVEGGQRLFVSLLQDGLIDQLIICRAGKIIGEGGISLTQSLKSLGVNDGIQFVKKEIYEFGNDIVEIWG